MASYKRGGEASEEPVPGDRRLAGHRDGAEPDDRAIGMLPGVVNDLPEVAPHEWIYLMS